jgi:hypothetical protein
MELKTDGMVGKLIDELHDRTEAIAERARQFPMSREEYLALPIDQRMEVARDAVKRYGAKDGKSSEAVGTFTTEQEATVIVARLEYGPERGTSALNDYFISKYESIGVSARAVNTNNKVATGFSWFGEVEWGGYKIEDGSQFGKWIHELHANLPYTVPPSPQVRSRPVALNAPEAADLISIVDEITGSIIEGVVARERQLGNAAVAAVSQEA